MYILYDMMAGRQVGRDPSMLAAYNYISRFPFPNAYAAYLNSAGLINATSTTNFIFNGLKDYTSCRRSYGSWSNV